MERRQLTPREVIRLKHEQAKETRARVRDLEKALAKVTSERDDWKSMFYLRKEMVDLSFEAVLQQNKINDDLRAEINRLKSLAYVIPGPKFPA